jgi:hypothetical protein
MGSKQKRRGQHILLFPAACLISLILTTGCRTAVEPSKEGIDSRLDQQETLLLDRAESLLLQKNYAGAMDSVDQAIACCNGRSSERALRILETALTDAGNPMDADSPSIRCFKQLQGSLPDSVSGPAVRCWAITLNEVLADQAEIQKLKNTIRSLKKQIEQLKAVDLEPETPKPGGNDQ